MPKSRSAKRPNNDPAPLRAIGTLPAVPLLLCVDPYHCIVDRFVEATIGNWRVHVVALGRVGCASLHKGVFRTIIHASRSYSNSRRLKDETNVTGSVELQQSRSAAQ